tara:strand:- start:9 stop:305 length:297 start_codon:yes stop_codon:yes gene_type:complete
MKYHQAIIEINPSAQCDITNNDLETINWTNGTTPIAKADIIAKATEIETRDAHIKPRHNAYPSIEEQLDMQYKDIINSTTTWKDAIAKVKSDNPKSED